MTFSRGVFIFLLLLLVSFLSAFLLDYWLLNVETLGIAIPKIDISNDYITALLWSFFFAGSILFWPVDKEERRVMMVLWFIRCLTTLLFMLYYENFYQSLDSFGYLVRGVFSENYFGEMRHGGTANMDLFIQFLNEWLPIDSSYHALKVIFSVIGMLGVIFTYRAICLATAKKNLKILWFLGLFPSTLFWSSILGKDPIYFLGVSLFLFGIVSWYRDRRRSAAIFLLFGLLICCFVRLWAAPILLLPFLITEICLRWKPSAKSIFQSIVAIIALIYLVRFFSNEIDSLAIKLIAENINFINKISLSWGAASSVRGSGQELPQFQDISDLIAFLPYGAFTALFRPLPGEVNNLFGLLAGLENIFILIFMILSFKQVDLKNLKDPILSICAMIIIFWSAIYAFISSQNLGSGFRFRLQIISIIFLLIFYLRSKSSNKRIH